MRVVGIALLILAANLLSASEFETYPAERRLASPPAAPQLMSAKARRFRSVLRSAAVLGPNFNGHYRLVQWGCGTNCIEWAIVDLEDGRVWMAPEPLFSCAGASSDHDWFDARLDSSLLYVRSCRGDRGNVFDTRRVYRHAKGRLKLLRTESLRP